MEVLEYQASTFRRPCVEWIRQIRHKAGEAVIRNHVKRLRQGHFGDPQSIGAGVWELRIFFGPGYRIYYILDGVSLVILLCGGDKHSQDNDIEKAKELAADYWRRK